MCAGKCGHFENSHKFQFVQLDLILCEDRSETNSTIAGQVFHSAEDLDSLNTNETRISVDITLNGQGG